MSSSARVHLRSGYLNLVPQCPYLGSGIPNWDRLGFLFSLACYKFNCTERSFTLLWTVEKMASEPIVNR
jgi:hypothetical protein